MKEPVTKKEFARGLIAGALAVAVLLGLEAVERKLPEPPASGIKTLHLSISSAFLLTMRMRTQFLGKGSGEGIQ